MSLNGSMLEKDPVMLVNRDRRISSLLFFICSVSCLGEKTKLLVFCSHLFHDEAWSYAVTQHDNFLFSLEKNNCKLKTCTIFLNSGYKNLLNWFGILKGEFSEIIKKCLALAALKCQYNLLLDHSSCAEEVS